MVMLQRWKSLMEGEWFCYRGGLASSWRENIHVTEVASLKAGEWSLQSWSV